MGSTRGQPGIKLGQLGVNLGSNLGQPRVKLVLTAVPYRGSAMYRGLRGTGKVRPLADMTAILALAGSRQA